MKTILVSITHGHITRNLLHTRVLPFLLERKDVRLVLAVPDYKREYYEKQFGADRVIVEGVAPLSIDRVESLLRSVYYYFVDTVTVRYLQGETFLYAGKKFRYYYMRVLTKLFGSLPPLRKFVRFIDRTFVSDTSLDALFSRYAPDLVFIGSVTSNDDVPFMRQAKKRGIKSVGMVRSWDTITVNKGTIRIHPDKILSHSELLRDDVVKYTDVRKEKVEVVGLSHFDHYLDSPSMTREQFFTRIGGDPKKRMIFYPLVGLASTALDAHIVGILENMIRTRPEMSDVQLLVRRHPNEIKEITFCDPKITIVNIPEVIEFPSAKLAEREFTPGDMELLAHALRYADVLVNTQSTTSIDAAAFDKPVINIDFDEAPGKSIYKSARRFYLFNHYLPILSSGGVWLVKSKEELEDAVEEYLKNPKKDHAGRVRMLTEQNGGPFDGAASRRTAKAVLEML